VARSGQEEAARLFFLNWLVGYLSEQGIKDSKLKQALQWQRWQYRYPILRRSIQRAKEAVGKMQALLMGIGRRTLPSPIRRWLWAKWTGTDYCPPTGWVRFGSLRRKNPISQDWGFERGLPVDRYYIEQFLSLHALDVGGRVLEIADNVYTRQFGGERVTQSDILHIVEGDPKATIVGDLACADHIPSDTFDCVILTQTLQLIYDVRAALKTVYRILKPDGVVLATVPGISQISRYDMDRWGHFWSFTSLSARRLFEEVFPAAGVHVAAHGNVLTAIALLNGIVTQELRQKELDHAHPDYEVIIGVKAVKPRATG
jgi:SAM-dependent methyltransferase